MAVEFCQMTWAFHFKVSQTQRNSSPSFSGLCPFSWCTESHTFKAALNTWWKQKTLAGWCSQSIPIYSAVITASDSFFMLNPAFRVFRYNNSFLFSAVVITCMIDTALNNITHTFPLSPAQILQAIKTSFGARGNASSLQGNASKTKTSSSTNNQQNPNISKTWNGKVRCCYMH